MSKHIETINSIIAQLVDLRDNGLKPTIIISATSTKKVYPTPGPREFWVKKNCEEASSSVSSKKEFKKQHPKAYFASVKYGYIDEFFPSKKPRKYKRKYPVGFLTLEKVTEIASKYKGRGAFFKGDTPAYQWAHYRGLLDTLFPKPNHVEIV
jgi:hypothetical protein